MSIDKLAPQAVEAEQSVLGSILIDADAILRVGDFLKPVDFYRAQHSDIYEAMLALHGQREPIDLVTLGDELRRRDRLDEVGGPAYLTSLMNAVPTAVLIPRTIISSSAYSGSRLAEMYLRYRTSGAARRSTTSKSGMS